ncbi:MAG TPA: DUF493 domain-containing protein [Pseudomonadales bacterium]|nr:DUF493 domain-containing protein [Pseudomonadales bacterium]
MSNGINPELWEFPVDYTLKVMGLASAPLTEIVTQIVLTHAPDFDATRVSIRASSSGKYHSVTALVYLTHKEQVEGIYRDLHAHPDIVMTL